jgi:RNA polymerase primary sigma factor
VANGETRSNQPRYRGALTSYLNSIRRYPLLTASGERRLATRSVKGEPRALQRLVQSNLRLVVRIAREYRACGAAMEDLISEGNIGLMEAARRFDPTRGARFVTYSSWWIRKYVLAAVARHRTQGSAPIPRPSGPTASGERDPRWLVLWRRLLSFGEFAFDGERTPVEIRIASDDPAPEDLVQEHQLVEVLHDVLALLGDRDRAILEAHYGIDGQPPRSLQAIASEMNCTREWVRQLEQRAMSRARSILDARGFKI